MAKSPPPLPDSDSEPPRPPAVTAPDRRFRPLRALAGLAIVGASILVISLFTARFLGESEMEPLPARELPESWSREIGKLDRAIEEGWRKEEVEATPRTDDLTLIRRLSLSLTGAPPSLEEIQRFEALPDSADPVQSWLDHLFADPRYHAYFAERLARAYVGVEPGPFLVYRRRRLVNWLADELAQNRPYDDLVRSLVAADGLWTTNPEANFVTVAFVNNDGNNAPDPINLAARTSRAFLGISLDCMQCHDDKFGDYWKQEHFHELAAFYAQTEMGLSGLREKADREHEYRYLGMEDDEVVPAMVPYREDLLPEDGARRTRLARWITHEENEAFARAAVNRVWGLLLGRPLVTPVDDIPLEGPYPAGLEEAAAVFTETGHDLQALIRLIAGSTAFARSSQSADPDFPVTQEQESGWAAFPVTPLRSEQVAGSVIQAASLQALDQSSHIFSRIRRFGETRDFVNRYGDQGENEFLETAGTIPQRLLLMNGELVAERTKPNAFLNGSSRLANYAPDSERAVEAAFLATLTRRPTVAESEHFVSLMSDADSDDSRARVMEDIYWALINSTEFSWNR